MSFRGEPADQTRRVVLVALVAVIAVAVYCLPFFVLGEDARVRAHDNMDSSPLAATRVYRESNPFFGDGTTSQRLLRGQYFPEPRGPRLDQSRLFFYLLPPFQAYVVTQFLSRVLAFAAMYLFLSLWLGEGSSASLRLGVATAFCWLPHQPTAPFSVPLLPLAAWAVLAAYKSMDTTAHWGCLVAVASLGEFPFTNLFLIPLLLGFVLGGSLRARRLAISAVAMLALLTAMCFLKDYSRIESLLTGSHYVSHRVEFSTAPDSLRSCAMLAAGCFRGSQFHVRTSHSIIIMPAIVLAFGILVWRGVRKRDSVVDRDSLAWLVGLLLLVFWVCIAYGFDHHPAVEGLKAHLRLLTVITLRFYWLLPLLWYALFARALLVIENSNTRVAVLMLVGQLILVGWRNEHLVLSREGAPTFRSFFAERQFQQVADFVEATTGKKPSRYRVVSLGLHPSVASYNGFFCVDGYSTDYSLAYKHEFRAAIAGELAKDASLRAYFDNWGSRCYLFSSELFGCATLPKSVRDLAIDNETLAWMGCRYLLSSVRVEYPARSGLSFVREFPPVESTGSIYLYSVHGR